MSWFGFGSPGPGGPPQYRGRAPGASLIAPPPARMIPPGTVITPGGAVPTDTALAGKASLLGTGPQPPDASLAASQAAAAAKAAADKARKKATAASTSTVLTGMPGASTVAPQLAPRTLMGA